VPAVSSRAKARWASFGRAEVIVENLRDDGPCAGGVGQEIVQFLGMRVVPTPQPARTAEGRDAALHGDPGAGEGGEVPCGADEGGGLPYVVLGLARGGCRSLGKNNARDFKRAFRGTFRAFRDCSFSVHIVSCRRAENLLSARATNR